MTFNLSHFQSMVLFALMVSIAFGFLSRRPMRDRAKYIGWSFLLLDRKSVVRERVSPYV